VVVSTSGPRPCWFVGASFGGVSDQTERFIDSGIWETERTDSSTAAYVREMQPGDRIAIKAGYVRRKDLPIDNHGRPVAAMSIKAVGVVEQNLGDGKAVRVRWTRVRPVREWLFFTVRSQIWRVLPGSPKQDALIAFAFDGAAQDYAWWLQNDSALRDRYGAGGSSRIPWATFYEAMADAVSAFAQRRQDLVAIMHSLADRPPKMRTFLDRRADGTVAPLDDVCPFTFLGLFNRDMSYGNRSAIAQMLADALGVSVPVPTNFDGIPRLNNQMSWFFSKEYQRQPDDIDALWRVFRAALALADAEKVDVSVRSEFVAAFDDAMARKSVGWQLTCGLFWIRPNAFLSLDGRTRDYIEDQLGQRIDRSGSGGRSSGEGYLRLLAELEERFDDPMSSAQSFAELVLVADGYAADASPDEAEAATVDVPTAAEQPESTVADGRISSKPSSAAADRSYSLRNIIDEGCFVPPVQLEAMLRRLRDKKNIILQGAPGTGKSWLARRLAYALIGAPTRDLLYEVQFHPGISYEDFVRGYRPNSDGRLTLVDGPFLEIAERARNSPLPHILIIDEINRGNPSQIFGEMLTLLESGKRNERDALYLAARREGEGRFFLPPNLYVIGTMNAADRSIAMVDVALRRRFAFFDLTPQFGEAWQDWMRRRHPATAPHLSKIRERMLELNERIAADERLGVAFCIGHSFVTPPPDASVVDADGWFRDVVVGEIVPTLAEYWFDDPGKVDDARRRLLGN
jgi:5-methylcytosine-specific restriction protein B